MKKILFPTEFSAHASQVFHYALELAKFHKASVTLLHAYHVPLNPELSFNDIANNAMKQLEDFAIDNTPKSYQSVPIHCISEMGSATDVILKVEEEEEMDCIVMGMKGKSNAIEAFFGSITLDVVSKTEKPVFLIPSTKRFKTIEKIAFAFGLKLNDLVRLKEINDILGKFKASIDLVHFDEGDENLFQTEDTIDFIEDLFKYHPKYNEITFSTTDGKFKNEIHSYLAENNIDLLITQSHLRNWKFRFVEPSQSNQIARKINIPMLILKSENPSL